MGLLVWGDFLGLGFAAAPVPIGHYFLYLSVDVSFVEAIVDEQLRRSLYFLMNQFQVAVVRECLSDVSSKRCVLLYLGTFTFFH